MASTDASQSVVSIRSDDGIAPTKVISKNKKRTKLIRPRGKRGGIKNRKSVSKDSVKLTQKQDKPAKKTSKQLLKHDDDNDDDGSTLAFAAETQPTPHSLQISHFHTLLKELNQANITTERRLAIEGEIESLGGLEAYQDASLVGADKSRGGESGKWCAAALQEVLKVESHQGKIIRLLDVGALTGTAYTAYSKWIHTTSIDLNPRGDNVEQYDFFEYPVPQSEEDKFDVIALSLVLNFVGDLDERGELLLHAHSYLRSSGGYLYLVLPLACVSNSRYLDHTRLEEILDSTGWSVVKNGDSKRLTRWLLKSKAPRTSSRDRKLQGKRDQHPFWDGQRWKKEEIRVSATANNFCIKVRAGHSDGVVASKTKEGGGAAKKGSSKAQQNSERSRFKKPPGGAVQARNGGHKSDNDSKERKAKGNSRPKGKVGRTSPIRPKMR